MSLEISSKLQALLWWMTSIAVSVLCCSVLFVLFASYLVDAKAAIRENNMRIDAIEQRENTILAEIQILRKQTTAQPVALAPVASPPEATVTPPETSVAPAAEPTTTGTVQLPTLSPASTTAAPK